METNNKILSVSLLLLISQLSFCLFNIWYSQNRYITKRQQQSYMQYLYSTDANLEELKNRLKEIKIINQTLYENILQMALKHDTKEVLLLLSVGEGIEFMPKREQQIMVKIIMSRLMKHFPNADLILNGKPKANPASPKPSLEKLSLSGTTKPKIRNTIKKTGKEKLNIKNPSPAKVKDTGKDTGKNSPPEKIKSGAPSQTKAKYTNPEKNNSPEKPKEGTPIPVKLKESKQEKNILPKNQKATSPPPIKVKDIKPGKNNPPKKLKPETPIPAKIKDTKLGKTNPHEQPEARKPIQVKLKDIKPEKSNLQENLKAGTRIQAKIKDTKVVKANPPEKPKTGTPISAKTKDTKVVKANPSEKQMVGKPAPAQVKHEKKVIKIPKPPETEPCKIDQSLFNGRENVSYEECSMTLLESRFSNDTLQGGRWFPRNCKPQKRIAIIVPYRDRDKHLKLLLNNLIPKLRRQMMDYTFYVVEQASAESRFNRGLIRNIGFWEAKKEAKYDCYIFNDVDTIIENDLNFYTCAPNSAYHIAVRIAKHEYRHLYKKLIGGIVSFTEDFFLKTNGYSNFFFIWGGEDDVMYRRVKAVGGTVTRPEYNVSHTTTAMHDRDPKLKERFSLLQENSRFWKKDGLNTLEYQKLVTEKRKLYTWIYVNINETKYSEMMENYNAEWKRLHPNITTSVSIEAIKKDLKDGTK